MDTTVKQIGAVVVGELCAAGYLDSTIGQYEKTIGALAVFVEEHGGVYTPASGAVFASMTISPRTGRFSAQRRFDYRRLVGVFDGYLATGRVDLSTRKRGGGGRRPVSGEFTALDAAWEADMDEHGLAPATRDAYGHQLQRNKITILLGYQEATAGGLMSVDYLSVPATSTAADTIRAIAEATDKQPEAIVVAFCHDQDHRLVGAVSLVALVQSAPDVTMETLSEPNPVHVHPDADLPEITRAMADYNLLVMPVLDPDDHQIGVLTIDDILEATIPHEWRRRRE